MSAAPASGGSRPELDHAFDPQDRVHWQAEAEKALRDGQSLGSIAHQTIDDLIVQPLYSSRPPSTHHLGSARQDICANRVRTGLSGDPAESNQRVLHALEHGCNAVELLLESSGMGGASLRIEHLDTVLDSVRLDAVPLLLRTGIPNASLVSKLINIASRIPGKEPPAGIHLGVDPLGTRLHGHSVGLPLHEALLNTAPLLKELSQLPVANGGEWSVFAIDTVVHHNAGASEVQELVAAIATAAWYLDVLHEAGIEPAAVASAVAFHMACDADQILNVAKLRSLALLWQHLQRNIGIDPAPLRLHVETSKRQISRREPWVNHLRNTSAAMSALMGGASSLLVFPHTVGMKVDEQERALAERLARNVTVMLEHESHLGAVSDPYAGAYAIESLCEAMCTQAWRALQQLQRDGGWLVALAGDRWRNSLAAAHTERERRLLEGEQIAVGVNRFNDGPVLTLSNTAEDGLMFNETGSDPDAHIRALPRVRASARFEISELQVNP